MNESAYISNDPLNFANGAIVVNQLIEPYPARHIKVTCFTRCEKKMMASI